MLEAAKRHVARQDAVFRAVCDRWHYRPERLWRLPPDRLTRLITTIVGKAPTLPPAQVAAAAKSFAERCG